MRCSFLAVVVVSILSGCGDYQKEQVLVPANYSVNQNHLTNSNFQYWQRGVSVDVKNGELAYLADRWYTKNDLGDNSLVRYERVEGLAPGSAFAAAVKVAATPQARESGGVTLFQVLEASDSLIFQGKAASFSILVRAIGTAQQVGVQLMYAKSEKAVTDPIGTEQTFNVGPNHLTLASLQNVYIGDQVPRGGVLGVRIRVVKGKGLSFEGGSGFAVEQAMLNLGPLSAGYQPRAQNSGDEFRHCLRYYEKSYDLNTSPMGKDPSGSVSAFTGPKGEVISAVRFTERKRIPGYGAEVFNPGNGQPGTVGYDDLPDSTGVTVLGQGESGFNFRVQKAFPDRRARFHWSADAEIR